MTGHLSPAELKVVQAWWRRLSIPNRLDIAASYELNKDSRLTVKLSAKAMGEKEAPEEEEEDEGWEAFFKDLWVNAGDQDVWSFFVSKDISHWRPGLDEVLVIHICHAHPLALEAALNGLIPSTFSCPLSNGNCPMRNLVNTLGGQDVQLFLRFGLEKKPLGN